MNTTENKILLIEFLKLSKNLHLYEHPITGEYLDLEDFDFDKDWNLLMEVVEKIYSTVDDKRDNDLDWDFLTKQIRDSFYFPTKEAVYNVCLEFIKWYNLNK